MNINFDSIQTAAKILSEGKLVALPTETVYGLAGDARNIEAIRKIFRIKNRPPLNPLIIHLSHISAMQEFAVNIPETAFILAKEFWPGPLTLVLQKHPSVLSEVTGNQNSVALRVPDHPIALAVLELFGGGLAAPSANISGGLSPTKTSHVRQNLGDSVDYILEGGSCRVGIESTIVSLLEEKPIILRPGVITEQHIAKALGLSSLPKTPKNAIETPGSHLQHYAPRTPLFLCSKETLKNHLIQSLEDNKPVTVLSITKADLILANLPDMFKDKEKLSNIPWITLQNNPTHYAKELYAALHTLDSVGSSAILVEEPAFHTNTLWLAIQDRLQRAAYH